MAENNDICLYEKISGDIKDLIISEKIKYREKVPSVSEIRSKYNVSHITAMRVFRELADESYIEYIRGRGYFANFRKEDAEKKAFASVCCITRPSRETTLHDNYFNNINQAVQRELMRGKVNPVYPFCSYSFADAPPDSDALENVRAAILEFNAKTNGFIIDERIPDDLISSIKTKISNPIVIIGRKSALDLDTVSPDNENGAKKAVELCLKMNYESFCIGRNAMLINNNQEERTEAFLKTLRENNVPEKQMFCFEYNMTPYEETFALIEKKLNYNLKTLIFSPTDNFARWLIDVFTKKGIKLGDKLGVMGFEGMGYSTLREPHVTTVDIHPSEMGRKAVEILLSRVNGTNFQKKQNYTVPASLQIGESI